LDDSDTFEEADAATLIAGVPLTRPGVATQWRYTGADKLCDVEVTAPGDGIVLDGSERTVRKVRGWARDALRFGGYEIVHRPGTVLIELLWSDQRRLLDREYGPSQAAKLTYDRLTKRPIAMQIEGVVHFTLRWPFPRRELAFSVMRYIPWKKPATRTSGTSAPPRSP
jgi:hypothetical protein